MSIRRPVLALIVPVLALALAALADEVASGIPEGGAVPPFKVRAITGDEAGQTLCYICKNQGAPEAIVFARSDNDGTTALIQDLNEYATANAEKGARAFVVLFGDTDTVDAWAKRLAEDDGVTIPICALDADSADATAEHYALNQDVPTTVLVARDNKVRANHAFADEPCAGCVSSVHESFAAAVDIP